MRWVILLLGVLTTTYTIFLLRPPPGDASSPAGVPAVGTGGEQALKVRISPLRSVVHRGETLRLRVEVWNIGDTDLLVCKDLARGPCALRLSITPLANTKHTGLASDCVPYEWLTHPPTQAADFTKILLRDWISIPPNHFYGTMVELTPGEYPELLFVGHYRVSGQFHSDGLLESYCYYSLKPFANEVAQLPTKSWQGEAQTNTVDVQVKHKAQ